MVEPADIHINLHGQFGYQNIHIHTSRVLGTGSYGRVFQATLDDLPCAAKILHRAFFQFNDPVTVNLAAQFDQECHVLRDLHHPCIVQFLGVVQDPYKHGPILLMELMKESLTEFLKRSVTTLPYHIQVNITHDIALALAYLHGKHIIHRDLSSNNVLLNESCRAKVTDFGMLKIVDTNPYISHSKISQCPGTPAYMSPEALRAKPRYSDKLDIFSLGVLIIQIITRVFPQPTDAEIVIEIPSEPTKIIVVPEFERRKKDIDKIHSDHALLHIALHCLKDRDKERPTATLICQTLEQLKVGEAFKASVEGKFQSIGSLEKKVTEIGKLQEQMRQLRAEEQQQQQIASHTVKEAQSISRAEVSNNRICYDMKIYVIYQQGKEALYNASFGQRQPPLYVTIQKILDKYPDGQIFKVYMNIVYKETIYHIS